MVIVETFIAYNVLFDDISFVNYEQHSYAQGFAILKRNIKLLEGIITDQCDSNCGYFILFLVLVYTCPNLY